MLSLSFRTVTKELCAAKPFFHVPKELSVAQKRKPRATTLGVFDYAGPHIGIMIDRRTTVAKRRKSFRDPDGSECTGRLENIEHDGSVSFMTRKAKLKTPNR